jgi:hypothetical protein
MSEECERYEMSIEELEAIKEIVLDFMSERCVENNEYYCDLIRCIGGHIYDHPENPRFDLERTEF